MNEQTIADSIRDFEKIAGLEEVIRCLIFECGLPGIQPFAKGELPMGWMLLL